MNEKTERNKEIARLRRSGDSLKSIAVQFDITPIRVSQIVRREYRRKQSEKPKVMVVKSISRLEAEEMFPLYEGEDYV